MRGTKTLRRRYGHFGRRLGPTLDGALRALRKAEKKVEAAHGLAPAGRARTILAGVHSDIFNAGAECRQHIAEVKRISGAA